MHGILHLAKCAECSIQRRETHRYPALLRERAGKMARGICQHAAFTILPVS
jgi:hypothetical protein